MASVGFWDPSMSAPPAGNLARALELDARLRRKKGGQRPQGFVQVRAPGCQRMPECDQGLHRLTHALEKIFFFLPVGPVEIAGLTVVAALDRMALPLHQYASDRSSTASPTNHGPIGSSHGRTPTLLVDRGAESAHRLALNLVISSHCCVTPGPGTRRHDKSLRIFLRMQLRKRGPSATVAP